MRLRVVLAVAVGAIAISVAAACTPGTKVSQAAYDPRALPSGALGRSIAYGHDLIVDTDRLMKPYVRAGMSCDACHLAAGTQPRGGSFVGVYARFPQWNKRAHRVIALQDRIAECFLYSMNGKAPAYSSKAMIGIVAYIAWVSRGTPIGAKQAPSDRYIEPLPSTPPDLPRGSALYAQRCIHCHQRDGGGKPREVPPLWGPRSFNAGAGMAHLDRMTGFVHYNMPEDAPGSLSLQDAYDVAAFVLRHSRPQLRKEVLVVSPALPAKFF